MAVGIRLARFGCRHRPFYRLIAADRRSQRDGKHLEVLGFYDPLSGEDGDKWMGLKFDRVQYWLSVGAQPSETVEHILIKAGIIPPPPMLSVNPKGGPWDSPLIDAMSDRHATSESTEDAMPPASLPLCLSVPLPGAMDSAL